MASCSLASALRPGCLLSSPFFFRRGFFLPHLEEGLFERQVFHIGKLIDIHPGGLHDAWDLARANGAKRALAPLAASILAHVTFSRFQLEHTMTERK